MGAPVEIDPCLDVSQPQGAHVFFVLADFGRRFCACSVASSHSAAALACSRALRTSGARSPNTRKRVPSLPSISIIVGLMPLSRAPRIARFRSLRLKLLLPRRPMTHVQWCRVARGATTVIPIGVATTFLPFRNKKRQRGPKNFDSATHEDDPKAVQQ